MEGLISTLPQWLGFVVFTLFLAGVMVLLVKVFVTAVYYKRDAQAEVDKEIHNFDFSESHRLLMEREDIVQMTEQGYYDPMDQVFSLQKWKQKVAHYVQSYDCYQTTESPSDSHTKKD